MMLNAWNILSSSPLLAAGPGVRRLQQSSMATCLSAAEWGGWGHTLSEHSDDPQLPTSSCFMTAGTAATRGPMNRGLPADRHMVRPVFETCKDHQGKDSSTGGMIGFGLVYQSSVTSKNRGGFRNAEFQWPWGGQVWQRHMVQGATIHLRGSQGFHDPEAL